MAEEETGEGEWYNKRHEKQYNDYLKGCKMIVRLTKEQILILSFAIGLYTTEVHKQNMVVPTDMKKSAKDMGEIMNAFNTAIEE